MYKVVWLAMVALIFEDHMSMKGDVNRGCNATRLINMHLVAMTLVEVLLCSQMVLIRWLQMYFVIDTRCSTQEFWRYPDSKRSLCFIVWACLSLNRVSVLSSLSAYRRWFFPLHCLWLCGSFGFSTSISGCNFATNCSSICLGYHILTVWKSTVIDLAKYWRILHR